MTNNNKKKPFPSAAWLSSILMLGEQKVEVQAYDRIVVLKDTAAKWL